jgi:hypothetical protein
MIHGLLFHGSLLFAVAVFFQVFIRHEQFSLRFIGTDALVWFFGGLIGGLWAWDQNEMMYRVTHIPAKPDRLNCDAARKES